MTLVNLGAEIRCIAGPRWTGSRVRDNTNTTRPANVWIFHGTGAHFASGVFTDRDQGMAWIALHRLTGILTEYPSATAATTSQYETTTSHQANPIMERRHTSPVSPPATPTTSTCATALPTTTTTRIEPVTADRPRAPAPPTGHAMPGHSR